MSVRLSSVVQRRVQMAVTPFSPSEVRKIVLQGDHVSVLLG